MISVIMGVYNNEKTVEKAVKSILEQSYQSLEFIICDDGSTDGTYSVLQAISAEDERVVLLKNPTNRGLAYSLNRCLAIAQYDFIARMDADDVSLQSRLQKEYSFLSQNADFAFVGTGAFLVCNGVKWSERKFPSLVDNTILLKSNPFIHPSLLFRRSALAAVNGYTETKEVERCEDYDLYFRLYSLNLKGFNLPDLLLEYSENQDSALRHSFRTRKNEHIVRLRGNKLLKGGIKGFIYSFIPLVLAFLPQRVYNSFHKRKIKKS